MKNIRLMSFVGLAWLGLVGCSSETLEDASFAEDAGENVCWGCSFFGAGLLSPPSSIPEQLCLGAADESCGGYCWGTKKYCESTAGCARPCTPNVLPSPHRGGEPENGG